MGIFFNATVRTAQSQAVITEAGAGAKLKAYNGTKPAAGAAVGSGNLLLATLIGGSTVGVASATGIDVTESGFTQNPAAFQAGTPTFVDLTTAGDVLVARFDIGGAGNWTFGGAVVVNQAITLTNLTIPVGNAT
jgi:hypothetical protein